MTNEALLSFDRDISAFLRELPRLADKHEGEFALIRAAEVVGIHPSEDEAINAGYKRFGQATFLVKQILRRDLILAEQSLRSCQS